MGVDFKDDGPERSRPENESGIVGQDLDPEFLGERIGRQVHDGDRSGRLGLSGLDDRLLAVGQAGDVVLGHFDDDLDPGVIDQGQDAARGRAETAHHRVDDIADLGVPGSDDAAPGRGHDRLVQDVTGQIDARPGLGRLGPSRFVGQFDLLVLGVGDGLLGHQPVHPLLVAGGVLGVGLGHGRAGFRLLELEADRGRVELGQELSFLDELAFLNEDAGDLAAGFGRDVDFPARLDDAGINELFRYAVAGDGFDLDRHGPRDAGSGRGPRARPVDRLFGKRTERPEAAARRNNVSKRDLDMIMTPLFFFVPFLPRADRFFELGQGDGVVVKGLDLVGLGLGEGDLDRTHIEVRGQAFGVIQLGDSDGLPGLFDIFFLRKQGLAGLPESLGSLPGPRT